MRRAIGRLATRLGKLVLLMAWVSVWVVAPLDGYSQVVQLAPQVHVNVYSPNLVGHNKGYWPVICAIENQDMRRHEVEVRCPQKRANYEDVNWQVSRKVVVEPQSTARITLWLPAPSVSYPPLELEFFLDGRDANAQFALIPNLRGSGRHPIAGAGGRLPTVLSSPEAARIARFLYLEKYLLTEEPESHNLLPPGIGLATGPVLPPRPATLPSPLGPHQLRPVGQEFQLVVWEAPLAVWDTYWISYTPFEGMVMTPKEWEEAPANVRDAVIRWVECGGMLAFLDLQCTHLEQGGQSEQKPKVPQKQPLSHTQLPEDLPDTIQILRVAERELDKAAVERRRRVLNSFPATDALAAILAETPEKLKGLEDRPVPCGFGQVYYLLGSYAELDTFPGPYKVVNESARQWLSFWAEGVDQRFRFRNNWLQAPERTLAEALAVAKGLGVPIGGFFLLLLLHSLGIPGMVMALAHYKRRIWLVWLVPLVALMTCVIVFAYGLLGEGVSARVALRSLTILDEGEHRATTLGVLGLYSPITPPGGVQWDYEIEPTFLSQLKRAVNAFEMPRHLRLRGERDDRRVIVDWSEKQHLVSGWVVPRVREYVLARRSEIRRERLTLRQEGGKMYAANNLGVGLRGLIVCDHKGRWWRADYLPPGQEVELNAMELPDHYRESLVHVRSRPDLFKVGVRLSLLSFLEDRGRVEPVPDESPMGTPFGGRRPGVTLWPTAPTTATATASTPGSTPIAYCPGALSAWYVMGEPHRTRRNYVDCLISAEGPDPQALLCPGRYFAELEGSPFLEAGLRWVGTRDYRCWLVGILETLPR